MIEVELFLGYPVDEGFRDLLKAIDPAFYSQFIGNNPDYLQEMKVSHGFFLGKKIGQEVDIERLKLAEENIYSLLKRLLPEYPLKDTPLVLFPIPHE